MKKRILFILHLPPPVHGAGMVGQFLKESKTINEAFEADYINLTTALDLDDMGRFDFKKITGLFGIHYRVLKALWRKKYDLCYVSLNAKGSGYYKDLLVVILLKIFKKKIVYHFHNRGVSTMQHRRINDLLYRYTFRNSKSILLSKLLYADIAKYVREGDVFYCPNGIPAPAVCDKKRQDENSPDCCQVLFLSNMVVQKGIFVLLDACKKLMERKVPFHCHFVGAWQDVSKEAMQKKVDAEGLSHMISLHEKAFGAGKTFFFKNADVFVFPSFYHNECFPLVNLEAMQFELPIVTTTIGGIPDMVKEPESGFVVPPENAEVLADKLEILIKDPLLRTTMGKAGKKIYEENYTLERFEVNIKSILEQAMLN